MSDTMDLVKALAAQNGHLTDGLVALMDGLMAREWRLVYWQEWAKVQTEQRDNARRIAVSLENELRELQETTDILTISTLTHPTLRVEASRPFTPEERAEFDADLAMDDYQRIADGQRKLPDIDTPQLTIRNCWADPE